MATQCELAPSAWSGPRSLELGESDKDEREERRRVPLVVCEHVEVLEDVLVEEVRLVEQEDRVDLAAAEILDVRADGEEDGGGGRLGIEPERQTQLAVEIAAAERGVVTVGEPVPGLGQPVAECA